MPIYTYAGNLDPHEKTSVLSLRDGTLVVKMGRSADFTDNEIASLSTRFLLTPGASGPVVGPATTRAVVVRADSLEDGETIVYDEDDDVFIGTPPGTPGAGSITDTEVAAANKDGLASAPSMRTLGAGAQQAMPGNRRLDQLAAPTAPVVLNGQRITNLLDPSSAQDAATKAYVDATAQGLDIKPSARVATSANTTVSSPGATVDGVLLSTDDRVLLLGQTTGHQNGPWVFNGAGTPMTRPSDFDTSAEASPGSFFFVEEGTNADNAYVLTTDRPITLGTTTLTFTQFSGAGQVVAGHGLDKSGNTLDVDELELFSQNVRQTPLVGRAGGRTLIYDAVAGEFIFVELPTINVSLPPWNAVGNHRTFGQAAMTSGQNTISAPGARFSAADVGQAISVPGAGTTGGTLSTTVQSVQSDTDATLVASASTTVTAASASVTGVDDHAAIQAAVDYARAINGAEIHFPGPGYRVSSPVVVGAPNIRFTGPGRGTTLVNTAGETINVGSAVIGASITGFGIENIKVSAAGGHAIKSITNNSIGRFTNLSISQNSTGYSCWSHPAGLTFIDNIFHGGEITMPSGGTVPNFDLISSNGEVNANLWEGLRVNGPDNAPAFRVEETQTNNYVYGNTWRNISFEVCRGGKVHGYSANGWKIEDCTDWDMANRGASTADGILLSKTTGGSSVDNIIVNYKRSNGVLGSGFKDIKFVSGSAGRNKIEFADTATLTGFVIDLGSTSGNYIVVPRTATVENRHVSTTGYLLGVGSNADQVGAIIRGANIEVMLSAPPTVGTWVAGDRVINTSSSGISEWVCKTGGTPGTWAGVTAGSLHGAVNALDPQWGTAGDGSTDDLAALQAANAAVPSGGALFLPARTYVISGRWTITRSIIAAPGAIIKKAASLTDNAIRVNGTANIVIDGLTVDGNRAAGATGGGILWTGSGASNGILRNAKVTSTTADGIRSELAADLRCYDCESNDNVSGTGLVAGSGNGFFVTSANSRMRLFNCIADNNDRCGAFFDTTAGDGCHVDGRFERNLRAGVCIRNSNGSGGHVVTDLCRGWGIEVGSSSTATSTSNWNIDYIETLRTGQAFTNAAGSVTQNVSGTGIQFYGATGFKIGTFNEKAALGYGVAFARETGTSVATTECVISAMVSDRAGQSDSDPAIHFSGDSSKNVIGKATVIDRTFAVSMGEGLTGTPSDNIIGELIAIGIQDCIWKADKGAHNRIDRCVSRDSYTNGAPGTPALFYFTGSGVTGNIVGSFDHRTVSNPVPAATLAQASGATGNYVITADSTAGGLPVFVPENFAPLASRAAIVAGTASAYDAFQAAIQAAETSGGIVRGTPGAKYLLDKVANGQLVLTPNNTGSRNWVVIEGYGCKITLTANTQRFLACKRTADHDVFRKILVQGWEIDAANAQTAQSTVIFGNKLGTSNEMRLNFEDIIIRDIRATNLVTTPDNSVVTFAIGIFPTQAAPNEATQNYARRIYVDNVHVHGGNAGVNICGARVGGAATHGYNQWLDEIHVSRCRHTQPAIVGRGASGTSGSGTNSVWGASFHFGSYASGGKLRIRDCYSQGIGDVGLEINNFLDALADGISVDDAAGFPYYMTNYQGVGENAGTWQTAVSREQKTIFRNCHYRRTQGYAFGSAFRVTLGSNGLPVGRVDYIDCSYYRNFAAETDWLNTSGGEMIGVIDQAMTVAGPIGPFRVQNFRGRIENMPLNLSTTRTPKCVWLDTRNSDVAEDQLFEIDGLDVSIKGTKAGAGVLGTNIIQAHGTNQIVDWNNINLRFDVPGSDVNQCYGFVLGGIVGSKLRGSIRHPRFLYTSDTGTRFMRIRGLANITIPYLEIIRPDLSNIPSGGLLVDFFDDTGKNTPNVYIEYQEKKTPAIKTGAYTVAVNDGVLLGDATSAAFTITLPTAAKLPGKTYTIKRVNAGANAVTLDPNGSETIDGAATLALMAQHQSYTVVSDGTNWVIV